MPQDAETLETRQAAGSCRSGATVHLVSSNGTAVPVKASISHHPGTLGQGATWAVSFTRSTEAAAADERRLLLRVKVDGTVVGVSSGTPSTLFGWDPLRLVGTRLEALVDIFYEYAKDGELHECWGSGFVCESASMSLQLYCCDHGSIVKQLAIS